MPLVGNPEDHSNEDPNEDGRSYIETRRTTEESANDESREKCVFDPVNQFVGPGA